MLIGIDCPSVSFQHEKANKIEPGQNHKWKFSITNNNP